MNTFFLDGTLDRPYPLQYAISLYHEVIKYKPKVCYELGSSWGFTTCAIAKALSDINEGGKLYSYEILPERVEQCRRSLKRFGLDSICQVETKDIFLDHIYLLFQCDFLYIDIHNNGQRVQAIIDKIVDTKLVYFEGGSIVRNEVCKERNVPTFENLDYDVIFGHNLRHSFSKIKK